MMWRDFLRGCTASLCIDSLWQDFEGKDQYLASVTANWIDPAISVPVAVIILLIVTRDLWRNDSK
jgi:hypothetical protein